MAIRKLCRQSTQTGNSKSQKRCGRLNGDVSADAVTALLSLNFFIFRHPTIQPFWGARP